MGCASSKTDDLPLVVLCRERRELLRAAADHRYVLAAAHASYFRALDRVGDALQRFAVDELIAGPALPILTLPPSKGKNRSSKSGESGSAKGDNDSDASASSLPSPLSSSVSPFSGSHLDDECHHLHSRHGSDSEESFGRRNIAGGGAGEAWNALPHSIPFPPFSTESFYYMKAAPTVSSTVYLDPLGEHWSNGQSQLSSYDHGYGYGYQPFVQDGTFSYEPPGMSRRQEAPVVPASMEQTQSPPPPPPPPPPQGSPWEFFNPFDSYEQMFDGYTKSVFRMGSAVSSPNSSEVREQEGIPDLEEETEQDSMKETGNRSTLDEKRELDDDSDRFNSSVGSSEAVAAPYVGIKSSVVPEKQKKRRLVGEKLSNNVEIKEMEGRNETPSFGKSSIVAVTKEDTARGRDSELSIQKTKDVIEAVKEITEQFKSASCCGEDLSRILEVGKVQYRQRIKLFKGASIMRLNESACADFEKYISMKSNNLSSTLEQLYLWEKKLYKEVKGEEKLRMFYDRAYARLKALDDRGAEASKIDSTRAAISKLITKISITIKSVDAISRRIHKLRDEELRPQLLELIHGLIKMWSSMLDCHQRQFQAILEANNQKFLIKSIALQSVPPKVTSELELELMNWCSCFTNWVRAQKDYIESLNGWLMKWLLQDQEDTPDGIAPFSPARIGAPAIFIVTYDWHNVIAKTSEDKVLAAMHSFASNLHKLFECQDEEQQQKLKAEYLSKDFERRLEVLQKHPDASPRKTTVSASKNNVRDANGGMMDLDLMRKRLDEEKAKHVEAMKQIQEVASCSLKTGLIPIFEALENYSSETLKLYSELRVPAMNDV